MNRLISSMLPPPKKRRSKAEAWVETHARRRRRLVLTQRSAFSFRVLKKKTPQNRALTKYSR
jgi:hypothetical protein